MYDPLAIEVTRFWWSVEEGNLGVALGPDPAGVLVEAIGVFASALRATSAEDRRIERAEHEAAMRARREGY